MNSQPFRYTNEVPLCSHEYVAPKVLQLLRDLPQGARVLDLGCGNGALLAACQGRGWELHGIDLSASAVEVARKAYPAISFAVADITGSLTGIYPQEYFDAIISTEVIEHLYSPQRFISNCRELLKPSGKLILTTPYHGYVKNLVMAAAGKLDAHFTVLHEGGHIKFWSRNTLSTVLWEQEFQDVQFAGAGRVPLLWKSMVMIATRA